MRTVRRPLFASIALALLGGAPQDDAGARSQLAVLYVAESGEEHAERRAAFEEFLSQRFESVSVVDHETFDSTAVEAADVVLLDWHQGVDERAGSPLGPRELWTKPCVLLGSAGLLTAMKWEVLGGSG